MRPFSATVATVVGALLVLTPARGDDGQYWVVGNPTSGCRIVTANPIVDGGNITFSDGPYRSEADARLAMSTIGICKTS
ncbi:hypothetical protein [Bradyrhizobium sp. WD16]|uniref:hypothetical protein n=1 Tax=Bradyrhizobium sp. WD16 TaxID=1521768 RepID=UPI0020A2D477|nr:hypothetical protein [Bradyrhizobium sp. WD16]